MKKVFNQGTKKQKQIFGRRISCGICGCDFSFEDDDVESYAIRLRYSLPGAFVLLPGVTMSYGDKFHYVTCPQCGRKRKVISNRMKNFLIAISAAALFAALFCAIFLPAIIGMAKQ